MTAAPAPSPAEQAVIDRFGIFETEERVAWAIEQAWESLPDLALATECSPILAVAAIAALEPPR